MIHLRHTIAECARLIVGLTFVASGLLKAVDPVGTALKITEYLAPVFAFTGHGHSLALGLSFVLCAGEFILGAFLLAGSYRRVCARFAFVFMILMTLVTGYILIADPVSDCGCFGDALHLTNLQTFLKNLVLLPLSYLVLRDASALRHLFSLRERWVPTLLALGGIIFFLVENYRHLPLFDFRPYTVGLKLDEAIIAEEEQFQRAALQSTSYIYEKAGEQRSFSPESLPDSSWTFVRVQDSLALEVFKPKYDFAPVDSLGYPMAEDLLSDPSVTLLLLAPSWDAANQSVIDEVGELATQAASLGYRFYGLTASGAEEIARWRYQTGASYPMLQMDPTPIRTMIRAYPGLLVLRGGQIIDKRAYSDFPKVEEVTTYLKELGDPKRPLPTSSYVRTYPLLLWALLLVLAFLRFWARKLHLTLYLKRRIHYSHIKEIDNEKEHRRR